MEKFCSTGVRVRGAWTERRRKGGCAHVIFHYFNLISVQVLLGETGEGYREVRRVRNGIHNDFRPRPWPRCSLEIHEQGLQRGGGHFSRRFVEKEGS